MKAFKLFIEILGWLQIVASPLIPGLVIGIIIYVNKPNVIGLSIAIVISLTGLITGIIIATRIWKKKGTVNFLSEIRRTPELDKDEK